MVKGTYNWIRWHNWDRTSHAMFMVRFRYRLFNLLNTMINIMTIPIASTAWTTEVINRSVILWKIEICNGATTTIKNNETVIIITHIKKIMPNNPRSFISRIPFYDLWSLLIYLISVLKNLLSRTSCKKTVAINFDRIRVLNRSKSFLHLFI